MSSVLDTANQHYRVTFYERENPLNRLTAWLGDSPPTPSGGGGGYTIIPLPFRSPVSVWQGRGSLLVQDIPIMLWNDTPERTTSPSGGVALTSRAATQNLTTAAQARRLINMWRPAKETDAPPIIRVKAPNDLIPYTTLPFWISDFTWGAAIGTHDGRREMQQLVIQLTEYREDEELQTDKAKKPRRHRRHRTYVVRNGDTLMSIAAKYHLRNGWRQLAAAQHPPINDPRQLTVGRRLIVP